MHRHQKGMLVSRGSHEAHAPCWFRLQRKRSACLAHCELEERVAAVREILDGQSERVPFGDPLDRPTVIWDKSRAEDLVPLDESVDSRLERGGIERATQPHVQWNAVE